MVEYNKRTGLYVISDKCGNSIVGLSYGCAVELYHCLQKEFDIGDCNYLIDSMSSSWDNDLENAPDEYQIYKKLITEHPDWEEAISFQTAETYRRHKDYNTEGDNALMEECFYEVVEQFNRE